MRTPRYLRRLKLQDGAQTLEFALVAPAFIFLVFAIMYALLVVSANVSLAHAASAAVRYAAIPTDNIEPVYPAPEQVSEVLFDSTPFFSAETCTTSLAGDAAPNAPVSLSVICPFANPLGAVLNGLQGLVSNVERESFGETFNVSAAATGRRE